MLSNTEAIKRIYTKLMDAGMTSDGAIGTLANIYAESACSSSNLQNTYEKKFGLTDAEYVAAIDNGTRSFIDRAGFGLCQWTDGTRKQGLYDFVKAKGVSIADEDTQVEYLLKELNSYTALSQLLKETDSYDAATRMFMLKFERPADQSESAQLRRVSIGTQIKEFLSLSVSESDTVQTDVVNKEDTMAIGCTANGNSNYTNMGGISCDWSMLCQPSNYNSKTSRAITSVCMHYTGNQKDTAWGNANFYRNTKNVGASAHIFVDENKAYGSVQIKDVAWHSGNKAYNQTSIGIEMACSGNYRVSEKTKMNAAKIAAFWLTKMNVPADKVGNGIYLTRHYDKSPKKKQCPMQMAGANNSEWKAFIKMVQNIMTTGNIGTVSTASSASTQTFDHPKLPFMATVNAKALNVRNGPGTTYQTMRDALKKDDEVKIIECSENGWGKLSDGGWISLSWVTMGKHVNEYVGHDFKEDMMDPTIKQNNTAETQVLTTNSVRTESYRVKVNTTVLNVRTGPGTTYNKSNDPKTGKPYQLKMGEVYTIDKSEGLWGHLKSDAGWIHLGYTVKM